MKVEPSISLSFNHHLMTGQTVALTLKIKKLLAPCVTSWKPVLFAHFLDAELLRAVAPYKKEKQECQT